MCWQACVAWPLGRRSTTSSLQGKHRYWLQSKRATVCITDIAYTLSRTTTGRRRQAATAKPTQPARSTELLTQERAASGLGTLPALSTKVCSELTALMLPDLVLHARASAVARTVQNVHPNPRPAATAFATSASTQHVVAPLAHRRRPALPATAQRQSVTQSHLQVPSRH